MGTYLILIVVDTQLSLNNLSSFFLIAPNAIFWSWLKQYIIVRSKKQEIILPDSTNKIGGYSLKYLPVLVIIVRLPLFFALRPVSVPFRPVPAGKLPLIFCPLVPDQWPA